MHKIIPKQFDRGIKIPKQISKPTVFEQLDKLKRLLRASGIKININELLKGLYLSTSDIFANCTFYHLNLIHQFSSFLQLIGSKTFQERCERIRHTLHSNGIDGEPTMAKCKQLKKQLKLKEEIAGLDPSVIIESKDENDGAGGRPKRTTRTTTRRNYNYDEQIDDTKSSDQLSNTKDGGATTQLLQKMREFIDSESSENEFNEHSQNGNNNNNNNNSSNDSINFTNVLETVIITNGQQQQQQQNGISVSSPVMQEHNNKLTENSTTQVITDNHSISTNI